jgi:hypothetical protein
MNAVGPLVALLVMLGVPLIGLLALALGIVALVRINRSGGELRGKGLAVGAIVLGGLLLLITPVLLLGLFLLAGTSRAEARSVEIKTHMEAARKAEEAQAGENARQAAQERDRRVREEEEARKRELEKQTPPAPPPPSPAPPAPAPAGR